jgi:hypothetical protein
MGEYKIMLHSTRNKASIVGAVVGGLAATQGSVVNILDIALGAAIWYGIVYGVCTLVIKFKK